MSWRRDTGTSPFVPPSETESESEVPEVEEPRPDAELPQFEVDSVSRTYTPPSSTPVRPYRYSDHIHQDRHIFLKGASLGIGCGRPDGGGSADENELFPEYGGLIPWSGGSLRGQDCTVDEHGNVFINGRCVQPGMALGNERLPALNRIQLAPPSPDWSKQQQQQQRERYPHLHQQHQPAPRRRPFNEQLNTYVDTQKRIRSVQCLEDLYRGTPSPVFPFLSTPTPRRPRPPPQPARIRIPIPRIHPPGLSRSTTSLAINQQPSTSQSKTPLSRINGGSGEGGASSAPTTASSVQKSAAKPYHSSREGVKSSDPEDALLQARQKLHNAQQTSSTRDYTNYFLAKEGRQGTLGRLFESYPKRTLIVHPGRMLRQRTDIVSRSRMRLLQ